MIPRGIRTVLSGRAANYVAAGVVGLLVLALAVQSVRVALAHRGEDRWRAAARAGELHGDSLEAELDTQRVYVLGADSARQVAERRAIQAEVARDSVTELLHLKAQAVVHLELAVDQMMASVRAPVAVFDSNTDIRVVDVSHREVPFTVDVHAEVPPPPADAHVRIRASLDPIPLTAYVGCDGEPEPGRVTVARVAIEGPAWADVRLGRLQADPDVCSPPPPPEISGWAKLRLRSEGALLVGVPLGVALGVWLATR